MTRPLGNPRAPELPLIATYRVELQAFDSKARRTAETYAAEARRFAGWLAVAYPGSTLETATPEMVREHLVGLFQAGLSASRRRVALYALRSVYVWLQRRGVRDDDPTAGLNVPRQQAARIQPYSDAEAARILQHAADAIDTAVSEREGLRREVEHLVMNVLRYTGVRVSELADLKIRDVNLAEASVSVTGKGSKTRQVTIPPALAELLVGYLREVRPQLPASSYLVSNPFAFEGSQTYGRLVPRAIRDIAFRHGEAAGVAGRHFPHRWRHTYATSIIRFGADLETVRRALGHASLGQVLVYTDLSREDVALKILGAWDTLQRHQDPSQAA